MKFLHFLAFTAFIGVLLFDISQAFRLSNEEKLHGSLIGLSLTSSDKGLQTLADWAQIHTAKRTTILDEARLNTMWDFVFIFGYVSVLIILSYNQMQKEPRSWVNELLRLNFLLAILTGLLDITENIILLIDMAPWNVGTVFYSSYGVSLSKFILGGWCVLVWLFSLLTSRPLKVKSLTYSPAPNAV